jgi:hypothetical protein
MQRLLIALLAGAAGLAHAEGAHQHGVARLELVAEGTTLTFTLDSPLDNLVGFERGPRTAAERAQVQAMAQRLHGGAALLQPSPAAVCTLKAVALTSDVIAPALLAKDAAAPAQVGKPPAAGGHADLEATFSFDCRTPAALKGVALGGLFQAFVRLRQLDAAVVAPGVQRGFKPTPANPQLAW